MIVREGEARELGLLGRDVHQLKREGVLVRITDRRPYRYRLELPNPSTSGEWLRVHRMRARLTKVELADRAGVERATVTHFEKDAGAPCLLSLYCILRVLGVRLAEHFARIDEQDPPEPLPVAARLSLEDAVMDARIVYRLNFRQKPHMPRLGTLTHELSRCNVNPINFWRYVDSLLGEMP